MGVSRQDIFGNAGGSEPAVTGSYGEPAAGFRLPAATGLGRVRLQVSDLERSLKFYGETLGLRVLDRAEGVARLGPHGEETALVELHQGDATRPAPKRGRLGLYHFAILLPDRPSLGRFVGHLGMTGTPSGSADHLVSEALYLRDPDNLGIEVYSDRPRASWRRIGRELMMATDPLDLTGLLQAAGGEPWTGMPSGTSMGHVHLHVGDVAAGSAYYSGALGFDRMVWQYPGALFLAAGGYHHHLGTNTWAGALATPPAPDEAQLLEWTVVLPDEPSLAAAEASLRSSGFPAERDRAPEGVSIVSSDPWGTRVRLVVAAAPAA